MEKLYLKPGKDRDNQVLIVPKPDGKHLALEGEWVERSAFWLRRLQHGDVVIATEAVESEPAKPSGKNK